MTSAREPLEHLNAPPIEEVVCGVVFPALPGLDTIAAGAYWHERAADFPKKELQPPILTPQAGTIRLNLKRSTVQRAWLVSATEDFLIQIQEDRFYLNWRRRDAEYPRFGDHDGRQGVLSRMVGELQRFTDFCARALQVKPVPSQAHLAKIDHLVEGQHWNELPDLVSTIPALGVLTQFAQTSTPALALRFEEMRDDGSELNITMDTALRSQPGQRDATRVFKIEKNAARPVSSSADLPAVLDSMNSELNEAFGRIFPRSVRQRLFHRSPSD